MKFSDYVEGALIATDEETEEFLESLREEEYNSYYGESYLFDDYGYDFFEESFDDYEYDELLDEFTEAPKIVAKAMDIIIKIIKVIRDGIKKFGAMVKEKAKKLLNNLRFKKQLNDAKKVFRKAGIKVKSADLRKFAAETEKGYVQSQQIVDRVMAEFLNMTLTEKKFRKYKETSENIFDSCGTNMEKVKATKKDIDGGLLVDDAMKVINNAENDPVLKALDKKLESYQKTVKTLGRVPDEESSEDNVNPSNVGALLQAVSNTIKSHRGKFITFCVSTITSVVSFGATHVFGKNIKAGMAEWNSISDQRDKVRDKINFYDKRRDTYAKYGVDVDKLIDPYKKRSTKLLGNELDAASKVTSNSVRSLVSYPTGVVSGATAIGTGASLAHDAAKEYKRLKSQDK